MFESSAIKDKVRLMLKSGAKPRTILAEVGGGLVAQDIYSLATEMRKAGELAHPTSGPGSKAPKKNDSHKPAKLKKGADPFRVALANEIKGVEFEIDRLNRLCCAYDTTNTGFAIHIEEKIKKETMKLAALQEFQEN